MKWNKTLRRDPICGMKETEGRGKEIEDRWYCSDNCVKEMEYRKRSHQ